MNGCSHLTLTSLRRIGGELRGGEKKMAAPDGGDDDVDGEFKE